MGKNASHSHSELENGQDDLSTQNNFSEKEKEKKLKKRKERKSRSSHCHINFPNPLPLGRKSLHRFITSTLAAIPSKSRLLGNVKPQLPSHQRC